MVPEWTRDFTPARTGIVMLSLWLYVCMPGGYFVVSTGLITKYATRLETIQNYSNPEKIISRRDTDIHQ